MLSEEEEEKRKEKSLEGGDVGGRGRVVEGDEVENELFACLL